MRISRGFVKIFLLAFFLIAILNVIAWIFEFYSLWMGYVMAGLCIFLAILVYNKHHPLFGRFMMFLFFLAIILLLVNNFYSFQSIINKVTSFKNQTQINLELENVTEIMTGDSFKISGNKIVKLLCVNIYLGSNSSAEESRGFLSNFILGKQVRLEKDKTDSDSLGRLLRYVYVDVNNTEVFVNREIVKRGFGDVIGYEPDTRRCEEIGN